MVYLKSNSLFEKLAPERVFEHVARPIVIADHLLTPENMGSLIRVSDNIGASELVFLGKAPTNSMGRLKRAAASSVNNIKWRFAEECDLRKLAGDKTLVAVETSDNATDIYTTSLPADAAFVLGNESEGLNPSLLSQVDMVVYIPVPGPTRSLNVTHAAAVALFEWYRQMAGRVS